MFIFERGGVWIFRNGGAALLGRQPPHRRLQGPPGKMNAHLSPSVFFFRKFIIRRRTFERKRRERVELLREIRVMSEVLCCA